MFLILFLLLLASCMFREGVRVLGSVSAEARVSIAATRPVSGFIFHVLMFYFLLYGLCIPVYAVFTLR
jgi:hypothetical protein